MPTKKVAVSTATVPKKSVTKTAPKKVTSPAAKTARKKSVATKTTSSAKKTLVYADSNTSFWVADGQILNSLVALKDALASMEKTVYVIHVSSDKNDFANWVSAVLNDDACARDLKTAKTPTAAKTVVVRHLKNYTF